jgi:uncharacterized protein (TIGR02466 family)
LKAIQAFFPTLIYCAPLVRGASALNRELEHEARRLQQSDAAGRRWSKTNYPGGYTSYASLDQLHRMSSTLVGLRERIDRHTRRFARALHWDLRGRRLEMTDCWLSIMGPLCTHGSHIHPQSVISGTYYVRVPKGAPGLRFEDPRLPQLMAAPARGGKTPHAMRHHVTYPARAGQVILFESWLRHEVPPHTGKAERISLSFNYHWV